MQIKTMIRDCFTLTRMVIINKKPKNKNKNKRTTETKDWWWGKIGALKHHWWEHKMMWLMWKSLDVPQKVKYNYHMTWQPCSQEKWNKNLCTHLCSSVKKEWSINTCYNGWSLKTLSGVKETEHKKATYYLILFIWNVQKRQVHRDRKEISCCQELEGREKYWLLNGYGVLFCPPYLCQFPSPYNGLLPSFSNFYGGFWSWIMVMSTHIVNVLKATELYTF